MFREYHYKKFIDRNGKMNIYEINGIKSFDQLRNDILNVLHYIEENLLSMDSVAIVGGPSYEYLVLSTAMFFKGITIIPISEYSTLKKIEYIIDDSNSQAVIYLQKECHSSVECSIDIGEKTFMLEKKNVKENLNGNLMYIIYTSGSSGCPKGVKISYESFANFFSGMKNILQNYKDKNMIFHSQIGFDVSIVESLFCVLSDRSICIYTEKMKNPKKKILFLKQCENKIIQWTSSELIMLQLFDHNFDFLNNTELVLLVGEHPDEKIVKKLLDMNIDVINMYGPTECTIYSNYGIINSENEIHITDCFPNMKYNLAPLENSRYFELVLVGPQVFDGYVSHSNNSKIYRTGDQVLVNRNHKLIYKGRLDNQVKIMGNRVELNEVENIAKKLKFIHDAVAVFDSQVNRLTLYYISELDNPEDILKKFLRMNLDDYSIPRRLVQLKTFPMLDNGKIDRKGFRKYEK